MLPTPLAQRPGAAEKGVATKDKHSSWIRNSLRIEHSGQITWFNRHMFDRQWALDDCDNHAVILTSIQISMRGVLRDKHGFPRLKRSRRREDADEGCFVGLVRSNKCCNAAGPTARSAAAQSRRMKTIEYSRLQ
jgi:hypothetical protein